MNNQIYQHIKAFFEQQSAFANFLQIIGTIIAVSLFLYKLQNKIKKILRTKSLDSITRFPPEEKWKLVIIDDQPEYFPVEFLEKIGFDIKIYDKISLADHDKLSKFDIALMDIGGVVDEDKELGGGRIIQELGRRIDRPIIISISNNKFGAECNTYIRIADERWDKNFQNEAQWKDRLEFAIKKHISRDSLIDEINDFLSKQGMVFRRKLLTQIEEYFKSHAHIDDIFNTVNQRITKNNAKLLCHQIHKLKKFSS